MGLLTYLEGPYQGRWHGGAFLIRMLGLRVPVRPKDIVLFVSRLWHEAESSTGVRFSLVSYIKKFGYQNSGIEKILVPEEIKWVFEKDFGLGFI